jgi:hypothetical protein
MSFLGKSLHAHLPCLFLKGYKMEKMTYYDEVRERLLKYKKDTNRSLVLVGEESGIAYQTIYQISRGGNNNPSVRTVEKLDAYLKSLGA